MIDTSPMDKHKKIALSFSGGKDSLAVVHLLRDRLNDVTVYHLDTGDLLPEMRESVARVEAFVPNFVRIQGDVTTWIAKHGYPTDLLPHSAHQVGRLMGEHKVPLVARYDCCYTNLMLPLFERVRGDGNTLLIRGTKAVDMKKLPAKTGDFTDGMEYWYPLQEWSNDQVFAFLREKGVPLPRVYNYVVNSPECARCSAWWGEGRAAYLKKYHPQLSEEYDTRLQIVADEIEAPLRMLRRELNGGTD